MLCYRKDKLHLSTLLLKNHKAGFHSTKNTIQKCKTDADLIKRVKPRSECKTKVDLKSTTLNPTVNVKQDQNPFLISNKKVDLNSNVKSIQFI